MELIVTSGIGTLSFFNIYLGNQWIKQSHIKDSNEMTGCRLYETNEQVRKCFFCLGFEGTVKNACKRQKHVDLNTV